MEYWDFRDIERMQSIHTKSALCGFASAILLVAVYAFGTVESSPAPTAAPALNALAVEVPASGWTDLGGAVYSPSEGIYQVVYGDFGNGEEFAIIEVVGFD